MAKAARTDAFCTHWLLPPLKIHLVDQTPEGPAATIELRTGDEPMTISAADGVVSVRLGPAQHADAVLSGSPQLVLGLLAGKLDLRQARLAGMQFEGNAEILRRVRIRTDK